MSSIADTKATKRFNLKLPPNIRTLFEEPFDAYLYYLLDISAALTGPFDTKLEDRLSELPPNSQGSSSRWTLWVSKGIRELFDERKLVLAPAKTHGGFVEMLLVYRNQLADNGELPPFVKDGHSLSKKSSQTSSTIGINSDVFSPGLASPFLFSPFQDDVFTFGSTMTLMDNIPTHVHPELIFGQDSSSLLQSYGMDSQSSGNTSVSVKRVVRKKPSLSVHTARDQGPYENAKKSRYTLSSKPPLAPFGHPGYQSATTMTNLNEDLNGLHIMFSPPVESFPMLPSADIMEATKLQYHSYSLVNPFEPRLSKEDTLPDLGPLYQPLSYQFGDLTHDFGFLPTI
ncbi:hypothetical protein HDU91_005885 [Kappamyces sp. JEL0680]|nr:hypothetical protein HDU91_005885 [Kappamyces sp. JEL0680]